MTRTVDVILDEAFTRIVRFVLAMALVWTALTGYVGWKLGVIEGRQMGAQVACEPIDNTVVPKKRPEQFKAVP